MKLFGLIGKNLTHSFSKKHFLNKFLIESINDCEYKNFELRDISEFTKLIQKNKMSGINVTIPYKKEIIPFLDELSKEAKLIGAVNTIQIKKNKLIGYNTDYIGFKNSISPLLYNKDKAMILGNGGAANAVKYALKQLEIDYIIISRQGKYRYADISKSMITKYNVIINTTPLGSFPKFDNFPKIPYQYLKKSNFLYDLIYNPIKTKFLASGVEKKCRIKNGLEMLEIQAEESWKIWNL